MNTDRYMVKAKTLKTGKWITGYYYKIAETTHCTIDDCPPVPVHHYILQETMTDWELPNQMLRYEIDPDTICQCTELTDKNGNAIFEYDILKGFTYPYKFEDDYNYYGLCLWFDDSKSFMIYTIKNPESSVSGISHGNTELMEDWKPDTWEIIGNELDNPELVGEYKEVPDELYEL